MITLTREEAQQVLDALICSGPHGWSPNLVNQHNKALKTLRARLSEPEPEPVACPKEPANIEELYTAPPQREWQGLTDEEILEEYRQSYGDDGDLTDVYFARAIEAKLKEKNT